MVRTANSARKQVAKKDDSKKTTIQVKPADKEAVGKIIGVPQAEGKVSVAGYSIAGKRPAKSLSVSTPKIGQKPKPEATRKLSKNIIKEIKYYQSNIGFLVPRATIVRVIRSTLLDSIRSHKAQQGENLKFTSVSLNIMHEAIENYLVCLLELSYMAARHAKRVTLFPSDIRLINRIRNVK